MEHPAEDVLRRFFLVAASREENRQVVRHLLARCPACAAALKRLRLEPMPPVAPGAYDGALARLMERAQELTGGTKPAPRLSPLAILLSFR